MTVISLKATLMPSKILSSARITFQKGYQTGRKKLTMLRCDNKCTNLLYDLFKFTCVHQAIWKNK